LAVVALQKSAPFHRWQIVLLPQMGYYGTLQVYPLACSLSPRLPRSTNLQIFSFALLADKPRCRMHLDFILFGALLMRALDTNPLSVRPPI